MANTYGTYFTSWPETVDWERVVRAARQAIVDDELQDGTLSKDELESDEQREQALPLFWEDNDVVLPETLSGAELVVRPLPGCAAVSIDAVFPTVERPAAWYMHHHTLGIALASCLESAVYGAVFSEEGEAVGLSPVEGELSEYVHLATPDKAQGDSESGEPDDDEQQTGPSEDELARRPLALLAAALGITRDELADSAILASPGIRIPLDAAPRDGLDEELVKLRAEAPKTDLARPEPRGPDAFDDAPPPPAAREEEERERRAAEATGGAPDGSVKILAGLVLFLLLLVGVFGYMAWKDAKATNRARGEQRR
jgi:hypothetical protein